MEMVDAVHAGGRVFVIKRIREIQSFSGLTVVPKFSLIDRRIRHNEATRCVKRILRKSRYIESLSTTLIKLSSFNSVARYGETRYERYARIVQFFQRKFD